MWLAEQLILLSRFIAKNVFPVLFSLLLVSCGNESRQIIVDSPGTDLQNQPQQRESVSSETSGTTPASSTAVSAPREIRVTGLRAGYVSLLWTSSAGDSISHHPGGDSVSYYRVLRNNEPFTKAFSPSIEDTDPPEGLVIYSVQAVKYSSDGEFTIDYSEAINISVDVPSSNSESHQLGGIEINAQSFTESEALNKTCINAFQHTDNTVSCLNESGRVWSVSSTGEAGNIIPLTSASGNGLLAAVENHTAEFGPIPDIPTWTVTNLATGSSNHGELRLDAHLQLGERHLVNGVAVSDNDHIFISGTIYQSYIPRSLGPAPGVLPITNGYFVLQFDAESGTIPQFKRFALAEAPGAVSAVHDGVIQMFQTGLITWLDASFLQINAQLRVTGMPVLQHDGFVYTESNAGAGQAHYFRFEL